jgi:hypothetical protein
MNEQVFACFGLLWTRIVCRLIMKDKLALMAVNRWNVCCCVMANSHIPCRGALIYTCHAASFVKVRVLAGDIRTASPAG